MAKVNKKTKTFKNLCKFIEQLPQTFDGVGEGYHGLMENLYKYNVALEADIRPLLWQMGQYLNVYQRDLELKLQSILFLNDRYLLAHDIAHSGNASDALREELKQYTDFMTPTERQWHEHRYNILDLFCTLYGLYGMLATIQALKKATGIKGFDFMAKQLTLERTTIKKGTPLKEIKAICKASAEYKLEDYIMSLNAGLIELKERGFNLGITPLDLAKVRPTPAIINNMIEKGEFIDKCMIGEFTFSIWQAPRVYAQHFIDKHDVYFHKLVDEERYLHPEAYARRFGED